MKNGISFMVPLEKNVAFMVNAADTQVPHQYSHYWNLHKAGSFTISYMHKFICMLKAKSVRNAYIGLTEEKRQHVNCILKRLCNSHLRKKPFSLTAKLTVARYRRSMTTQDRDVVETKQSRIHFHRKMHRLLRTLWSNSSATMNALAIIQRLIVDLIMPFLLTILHCFGVILEVGLFLLWSFKRFTALKTFIEKLIAESTLKNQKYGHLGTLCETRCAINSLQLITEWNDSSAAWKAEQLQDAVCRSSIVLSLAVLNKVLSLTLPLSTPLQESRLDVLQC
ncbi:hypothetical protein T07_14211 [Trichinella nelsoni]|uniref:Uncharacterized protein n=1 Tax=Trichinella nelsoni TaxID=6336 RepID=A0A0V0SIN2_9BILA|nr:hypothetical protein T07_14211 [Trichinella nelsoni]